MTRRLASLILLALLLLVGNVQTAFAADTYTVDAVTYTAVYENGEWKTTVDNDYKHYHMKATGTTGKNIAIYTDIGEVYNYHTDCIAKNAFKGNEKLESVDFVDVYYSSASAHQYLDMELEDSCLANCPNFKILYMRYKVNGSYVAIPPSWVRPTGNGIFDGSPNARIWVDAEYYDDYINDQYWKKYKDIIVPVTSMRHQEFVNGGAQYDYNRNHDAKCGAITETYDVNGSNVDFKLVNVNGADDSYLQSNNGKLTIYSTGIVPGLYNSAFYRTTKVWAKSFKDNSNLTQIDISNLTQTDISGWYSTDNIKTEIAFGDSAFANCPNLRVLNLMTLQSNDKQPTAIKPSQVKLYKDVFANDSNLWIRVSSDLIEEFRNDSIYGWNKYANRITGYMTENTNGASYKGILYSDILNPSTNKCFKNSENEALKTYLLQLESSITSQKFNIDELLVSTDVCNVYYKMLGGSDDDLVDDQKGVMTIVNDFGSYYNYRTIAVSPTAFQGNTDIKEITFQDLPNNYACSSHYALKMAFPDRAFAGCKNLKALNMYYLVTDGTDHYITLGPGDVFIGKDVFDGCDSTFTIRVSPDRYQEFMDDPDWARYKQYIRVWEYAPTAKSSFTEDGVEYDYAATLVNNMPNDKVTRLQYSLLNIPVKALRAAIFAAATTFGGSLFGGIWDYLWMKGEASVMAMAWAGIANQAASTLIKKWALAGIEYLAAGTLCSIFDNYGLDRMGEIAMYLTFGVFDATSGAVFAEVGKRSLSGLVSAALGQLGTAALEISDATGFGSWMQSYSEIYKLKTQEALGNTKYLKTTSFEDKQLDLLGDDNDYPEPLWKWIFSSKFQKTKDTYVNYKMYIKSINDSKLPSDGEMKIYNDIGSVYNYRTVAIGENAVRGNQKINRINFYDVKSSSAESYAPMVITVPDYAFEGCTNLQKLNMFIYMDYKANASYPLGPNNFCLLGEHVFDNCPNLKIHISRTKIDEFLADTIWCKYKDRFVVDDWTETKAFDTEGVRYGYNLYHNSLIDKEDGVFNIHVIGPEDASKESIGIMVDPGRIYDYHTTYVDKKAWYGNTSLKKIHFQDMIENCPGSNENATVQIELKDSCFANCSNLEEVCLMYHVFDGDDTCYPLSPSNITLGSGVFAGCPSTFKILVAEEKYVEFLTDPFWLAYADHIVPFYFKPGGISAFVPAVVSKYDGFSLYDYYTPTTLKKNDKNWGITQEKRLNIYDLSQYALYAYRESSLTGKDNYINVPEKQFAGLSNLHTIYFPYTIQSIGKNALDSTSVRRLYFSKCLKNIDANAFNNCTKLKSIELHNDNPQEVTIDETAFSGVPSDFVIYVPDSLVDDYKKSLPYYASHINGSSKCVKTTGLVTVSNDKTNDLVSHFGLTPVLKYKDQYGDCPYYALDETNSDCSWRDIDSLKVIGPVGLADLTLILNMASKEMGSLTYLDMSEAELTYDYNAFLWYRTPQGVFHMFFCLSKEVNGQKKSTIALGECSSPQGAGFEWGQLTTILWSTDPYLCHTSSSTHLKKIIFPEGFAGFRSNIIPGSFENKNYTPNLPNVAFLSEKVPEGTFIIKDEDKPALYVPYSGNASYGTAASYGLKAASTNSLFLDDEAFRVLAKKTLFTEDDYSRASSIGTLFRGNEKIKYMDDLLRFVCVTQIEPEAFSGCSNMESIAIPINVRSIGKNAFDGCSSLKSITMLTDTVPSLEGEDAASEEKPMFASLPSDFRIYVIDNMLEKFLNHPQWTKYREHIVSYQQTDSLITVTLTTPGTLAEKLNMTVVTDDHEVAAISGADISGIRRLKVNGPITDLDIALLHCLAGTTSYSNTATPNAALRYLDLSDAQIVKSTGSYIKVSDDSDAKLEESNTLPAYAFYNCDKLEKLILPRGVTKVCKYSLSKCDNLNTVIFGEKVATVEKFALEDSPRLVSIAITSENIPDFADNAFGSTAGWMYDKRNFVDNIHTTRTLQNAVASKSVLQEHTNAVKANFDDDAFFRTVAMHCVLDTASAERVNYVDGWFTGNTKLKDARQLRCFTGVEQVADSLFQGCTALEKVILPKNVTKLGDDAFRGCNSLQYVDMSNSTSLSIDEFDREAGIFNGTPLNTLVYLPKGNSQQFKNVNVVNMPLADDTADSETEDGSNAATTAWCHDYQIADRTTVAVPYAFRADAASTSREFNTGVKSTVFLPYGLSKEQTAALGSFYQFKSFNTSTMAVTLTRVYETQPNTAYLFIPKVSQLATSSSVNVAVSRESNSNEENFVGTYHTMNITNNHFAYGYVGETADGSTLGRFVKLSEGATVPSMRAYLNLKNVSNAKLAVSFEEDDEVTGIGQITDGQLDPDNPVNVYSADGRMVRSAVNQSECLKGLPAGIYIVGGKKYAVK